MSINSKDDWGSRSTFVSVMSAFLLLVGCGANVSVDSGPNAEASASSNGSTPASGGAPSDGDPLLASGGLPGRTDNANSAAHRDDGGTTGCDNPNWNPDKFDYGGSVSFVPGVNCACDVCGDATCTASLATVCARITGCRATLEAAKSAVDAICASHPTYALYSTEGPQNIIEYGLFGGVYRMGFDQESGLLVGASSSAREGLACYLGGTSFIAAGPPLTDPKPSCRLCADDTTDPTAATVPECPNGAIP